MNSARLSLCLLLMVSSITLSGCAGAKNEIPLELAKDSVQAALSAWKNGNDASSLSTHSPAIEFYDDAWSQAARLVEFEFVNTYYETDGFPRCAVALLVQYPQKEPVRIQVTYQVVMKPNLVIARDPFS